MTPAVQILGAVLLGAATASLFLQALGVWAVRQHQRRRVRARGTTGDTPLESVSLLKPLKGMEEDLEGNLRSFFEQSYPSPFEIVFSASEATDPGLHVARRLARSYPHVPCQFVQSDPEFGLNPKVANLQGALTAASHDLVLQSDGNVRVEADYLEAMVREMTETQASLLSSLVVGEGERSLGAVLENLQLTTFTAPAVCVALYVAGIHCVIGKAMLFRKSELLSLGGLSSVRDVLAEDYVIGRMYQRDGKVVGLASRPVTNLNQDTSVGQFFSRHRRWLQMRAVIHLPGFLADLGANPIPLAVLGYISLGLPASLGPLVLGLLIAKVLLDRWYLCSLRGRSVAPWCLLAIPLKDVLISIAWLQATLLRRITWRGATFWLRAGSALEPLEPERRLEWLQRRTDS